MASNKWTDVVTADRQQRSHLHGHGAGGPLPNKRNLVACLQALAAALRAPGLMATLLSASLGEHERALGG